MTAALELRRVTVAFGSTVVLKDASLTVAAGERVAITGANGSGKTTLLRLAAGLLPPRAGEVRVLEGSPQDPRIRARIGILAHAPHLYPKLTARENVRFWSSLYGATADDRLLAELGVDPDDRRPSGEYSHGWRKRIALACALAHRPDVLLLDEPFTGLDDDGAGAVRSALSRTGAAVVMATHDPDPAVCTRTVRLSDGRPAEAVTTP